MNKRKTRIKTQSEKSPLVYTERLAQKYSALFIILKTVNNSYVIKCS